ncbi:MAG: hypothetical protein HY093_02050 [Candidatus Liptonbacteria bacterium]|nr:hypothetical protein [Candidatus Liptonbacteria bacterium]
MTNFKSTFFGLILASCLLSPVAVKAVGLQVTPSEINIQSQSGQPASAEILVKNPSPEVGLFEVYPDDFENMIFPSPASFLLESGESRSVLVKTQFREAGIFKTNLSVVSKPLSDSSLNALGGLKIPISIEIKKPANQNLASLFSWFGQNEKELVGLLAFVGILLFLFIVFRSLFKKNQLS